MKGKKTSFKLKILGPKFSPTREEVESPQIANKKKKKKNKTHRI